MCKTLEKNDALGYSTTGSNGKHVKYRCSFALILNDKSYQRTFVKRTDQFKVIKEHTFMNFLFKDHTKLNYLFLNNQQNINACEEFINDNSNNISLDEHDETKLK